MATAAAEPDLLTELAEVERSPAQLLADAVESVRTSDEPEWAAMGRRIGRQTAQQLADAETAARRLDQAASRAMVEHPVTPVRASTVADPAARVTADDIRAIPDLLGVPRRFITPAGEVKTISGPDATPERQRGLCADGAWSFDPETGEWSCAECGRPAATPVLAEIAALQDDAPGQLVEVDLPPLQPRARWEIEGASPEPAKPEDAQVGDPCADRIECMARQDVGEPCCGDPGPAFPGADCDCLGDGDLHPPGSGGCVATEADGVGAVPEQLDTCRPIQTLASASVDHLLGDDPEPRETGLQHGPDPFGPPWATSAGPLARPRITLPGVYELSDTEYHDPAVTGDWVSNSDLKAMTLPGAPAKWKFKRDNGIRDERDVFQFGKAAHRRVLGVGAEVVARPSMWQDWRKQAAKDWRAEQQAAGRVVVTPEEAEVIEEMAVAMLANAHAADLLSRPGRGEVALFWRELLPSGRWVQRRAMLDFLPDFGPIADYKTCVSAAPDDQMAREISRFRYHWQAATYIAAVVALDLPAAPDLVFLFQEKSAPYLVTPVNLDDPTMMAAEIQNQRALEVYVDCLESGVWPGYTDGTVTMSIPEYELREYEMEIK